MRSGEPAKRIAVVPVLAELLADTIRSAGAEPSGPEDADGIVWTVPGNPEGLRDALASSPARWVQLPFAGIGAFFEPKLRERFGVQEDSHVLVESLAKLGVAPEDVHVVVLSHLHFDHAGGLLTAWREGSAPRLVFPNASYVVSERAWSRAKNPHPRDRASFIPELQGLLEATGRLEIVRNGDGRSALLGDAYSFTYSEGHTPGLMLTRVEGSSEGPVTFLGDLVPGAAWVHLPITMGYDRYPELLIDEKKALLERIVAENGWAFFTHDPEIAAARIARGADGRYAVVDERHALN